MSTATVEPPVAALSPVEYARRLSAKDRAALLAELLQGQPTGPVAGPTGESLGYFLPAAPANQPFPVLTPERQAEMVRRAADGEDQYISVEEALEWLKTATPTRTQ